ncbi:protein PELOTA 1 [Tanacetum coccineum]
MASHRLNSLYAIKECSTCGSLYTKECCSIGSFEDKILTPVPSPYCARCGTPVDGPYCRGCAFLRKEFEEDLITYCVTNGIFKDFQDTSESSDDNTNVVNALREPFVVNQDPGVKSSQDPPQIDHNPVLSPLQFLQNLHYSADSYQYQPKYEICTYLLSRLVKKGTDGDCGSAAARDTILQVIFKENTRMTYIEDIRDIYDDFGGSFYADFDGHRIGYDCAKGASKDSLADGPAVFLGLPDGPAVFLGLPDGPAVFLCQIERREQIDQFLRHLMLEAERRDLRNIIENKSRIILVHSTSGYKHSLREVLDAPTVMNLIKDTKAAQEVRALDEFFAMLRNHVEVANERMAVETLLITDELFRSLSERSPTRIRVLVLAREYDLLVGGDVRFRVCIQDCRTAEKSTLAQVSYQSRACVERWGTDVTSRALTCNISHRVSGCDCSTKCESRIGTIKATVSGSSLHREMNAEFVSPLNSKGLSFLLLTSNGEEIDPGVHMKEIKTAGPSGRPKKTVGPSGRPKKTAGPSARLKKNTGRSSRNQATYRHSPTTFSFGGRPSLFVAYSSTPRP